MRPSLILGAAALCLPLLDAATAAAEGLISPVPTVHVAVAGVESQAQLAERLRALGYSDIVLSATAATPLNPHPESDSATTSHPEQTPVHAGWNGIAVKNGQTIQVFADK